MNAAVTYQCPNCCAGLSFDAEKQKFACEFCLSEFTEEELSSTATARAAEEAASAAAEAAAEEREQPDEEFCGQINEYTCSSCGAGLLADEHTVATACPYCHNPVILGGKLQGQMKPHKIIPFRFDKVEAENKFLTFAKKKWFVPSDFFARRQAEKICGIYYPFWVTDADVNATLSTRATKVRTWRAGDYRYTETSNFHVSRRGEIHFEDIVTPALSVEDAKMLDGILPFPSDSLQEFSMPYLSGFVAKKRDVEKESVKDAVRARMVNYAGELLMRTVNGYSSVTPATAQLFTKQVHWEYTLMPIWLLTYRKKGKAYTYAMNGYTGKVWGELPVSGRKLSLLGGIVGVLAAAITALAVLL